jgi:hypothetical protein
MPPSQPFLLWMESRILGQEQGFSCQLVEFLLAIGAARVEVF